MLLYCIRHGESSYNVENRIQGQLDAPLSPLGRRQAQALAAWLANERLDAVYASPLSRALDTAAPLAAALGLAPTIDERLRELNAGIFQGLLADELASLHPEAAAGWRSQDPDFRIPGGESRRDLMHRGQAVFEAIRVCDHRRAAIVSHGGLLTAAFKSLAGVPAERNPFSLFNASISVVEWSGPFRLRTLNQLEHLRQAGCELQSTTGDL